MPSYSMTPGSESLLLMKVAVDAGEEQDKKDLVAKLKICESHEAGTFMKHLAQCTFKST